MHFKILAVFFLVLMLQACGNGSSSSERPVGSATFTNWSTVQKVPIGDSTYAATAVDGIAFYTDSQQGLSVVDTTDLEQVRVHTKVVDPEIHDDTHIAYDVIYAISVTGNVAAVAVTPGCIGWCTGGDGEIKLYDISDRSKATYLSTIDTSVIPETMLAEGNYLYVSGSDHNWKNQFGVMDLTDPRQPRQLATVEIEGAGRLAKAGNRVFISEVGSTWPDSYKRFQVVDVSNPAAPVLAGPPPSVVPLGERYSPIVVSGNVVYVSDAVNGLYVVDITDMLAPSLITTIAQPDIVHAMASHGNYLYLACGTGGMRVYDIKDPKAPLLVKEIPTSTSIRFVSVTNGKGIYISDGAAGFASKQELTVFYVDDAT